jgi:hypothetical protein
MKKLILMLFLPFISIGQVMTYEDLIGFENSQQVERFLVENNYERFDFDDKEYIKYGWKLELKDEEYVANKSAYIFLKKDIDSVPLKVKLSVEFMLVDEIDYNRIYDVAKKELEFMFVNEGTAYYFGKKAIVSFRKNEAHYINFMRFEEEEEEEKE